MNKYSILIVEDESIVAMEIESHVKKLGYIVVDICSNADDTLAILAGQRIDIILMDICIKGSIDGIETAAIIKKDYPQIKIIFLTAHMDDYNVDRAIKLNPIAYLAKPFRRDELRVSLKIAIQKLATKHIQIDINPNYIVLDNEFSYDFQKHILYCCHEIIHLTKKENEFLDILIQNKNCTIDFYTIENLLWPDKTTNTNTIRTLVTRVRQKLKHKFIETVPSQGYRIIVSTSPEL